MIVSAAAVAQPPPLTLDDAVKLALQRNSDLQRQILLTLSAEQDRVIARSAVLPRLDFNASVGRTRQGAGDVVVSGVSFPQSASNFSSGSAGLNLRQLIFDGGKWWNNVSAANLAFDANVAQVDEQRLQITYLVEQRFYELVRAQRQLLVLSAAPRRRTCTRRGRIATTTKSRGSARSARSSWRAPTFPSLSASIPGRP